MPARAGSKRIPRKNVRNFCGKPMLSWALEAAKASGCFDHIIVSTDDEEIKRVAQANGALVPFRRPLKLSGDNVLTRPVINHAINKAQKFVGEIRYVCCIYPTAAFITPDALIGSKKLLLESTADFIFSCASYPHPVQRALGLSKDGIVEMLWPEHKNTKSQDLRPTYHDTGQFYWGKASAFLANLHALDSNSLPWIVPRYRAHDIDTIEDWHQAELAFKLIAEKNVSFSF